VLRRESLALKISTYVLLSIGAIAMVLPFLWMISTSFKLPSEVFVFPPKWISERFSIAWAMIKGGKGILTAIKYLFDNYIQAWNAQPFARYFLNSAIVAVVTTAGQLIFSSLAAFAFVFLNFPGRDKLFWLLLLAMMFPPQVLLIPNYATLAKLGWINTYKALIVPWLASVYSIFFFRQFFRSIPKDLYEAAKIDGCSNFRFYWQILLPLSVPPMITMGVFSFVANWNAFIWPLIVTNSTEMRTVQVGLAYFATSECTEWELLMAASTFTILPLVIGYFLAQRWFIAGIARSGLKG